MRSTTIASITVACILSLASAYADTVTTADHLSINGSLADMKNGLIRLDALYSSGPKTLTIPLKAVETIEFNSIAFNPGAPPKASGLGPGVTTTSVLAPKQATHADVLELRGGAGERQPCTVVSIDEAVVHCEPAPALKGTKKPIEYSRRIVLRILVGGGR